MKYLLVFYLFLFTLLFVTPNVVQGQNGFKNLDYVEASTLEANTTLIVGGVTVQFDELVSMQFSVDGSTLWHADYAAGDAYFRISRDFGVVFGDAVPLGGGSISGDGTVNRGAMFITSDEIGNSPLIISGNAVGLGITPNSAASLQTYTSTDNKYSAWLQNTGFDGWGAHILGGDSQNEPILSLSESGNVTEYFRFTGNGYMRMKSLAAHPTEETGYGFYYIYNGLPYYYSGSTSYNLTSGTGSSTEVREEDGTPTVNSVTSFRFPNGSLTDNGSGSVSIGSLASIAELGDIGNVTITTPASGNGVYWNGSAWIDLRPPFYLDGSLYKTDNQVYTIALDEDQGLAWYNGATREMGFTQSAANKYSMVPGTSAAGTPSQSWLTDGTIDLFTNNFTGISTGASNNGLLVTKGYVDDNIASAGGGDMLKATYDTDADNIVDNTEQLNSQIPSYYLDYNNFANTPTIPTVSDAVYGVGWNGDLGAASKNSIYDKMESIAGGSMTYPTGSGIPIVVTGSSWGTTIANNSSNWNTAFGWGDHSTGGYLTAEVDGSTTNEIQTIDVLSLAGATLYLSLLNDGEATKTVDLSSLQDGTGTDDQTALEVNLAGYTKPGTGGAIGASDNLQVAIGKLERGLDDATAGGGDPNVQSDWDVTDTGSDAFILNKPTIPSNNNELTNGAGYLTAEVDGSITNEIQTIDVATLTGTTLNLSLLNDGEATKTVDLSSLQDGTGTDDQTATEVPIADAGAYFTGTDVEAALQELGAAGGGGSPGGSSADIQYNNAGAFGGFGNWNGTTFGLDDEKIFSFYAAAAATNSKYFNMWHENHATEGDRFLMGFSSANNTIISNITFSYDDSKVTFEDYAIQFQRTNQRTDLTSTYGEASAYYDTDDKRLYILNDAAFAPINYKARQSLTSATTIAMDFRSGSKASFTIAHNATLTISNIPDGEDGIITVTQAAGTSYTLAVAGGTGFTTEVPFGANSTIDAMLGNQTKIVYERVNDELHLSYIYEN